MGLFDNLDANAGQIARDVGLPEATVHAMANSFLANLTSTDGNPEEAIEAVSVQFGYDPGTVREIITRAGGLEGEVGDISEHSVRPGGI